MKKYYFLGHNTETNKCCIVISPYNFNFLKEHKEEIEGRDFSYSATNWGGCDKIERTLNLQNLELTSDKIELNNSIFIRGEDYDCGHSYDWVFSFNEILETKPKKT